MRTEIGVCNGCGDERPIVNKTHKLCPYCNGIRLDKQKSPDSKKKKHHYISRISEKEKKVKLTLREVYAEIALEREHICEGDNSINSLTHSHIIPVSQRKDLECVKENIVYHCLKCHTIWEHGTLEEKMTLLNFEQMMDYIEKVDIQYYNLITSK